MKTAYSTYLIQYTENHLSDILVQFCKLTLSQSTIHFPGRFENQISL